MKDLQEKVDRFMLSDRLPKAIIAGGLLAFATATLLVGCKDATHGFSMTDAQPIAIITPNSSEPYQKVHLESGEIGYRMNYGEGDYSSNVCIPDELLVGQRVMENVAQISSYRPPKKTVCEDGTADEHYIN